MKNSSSSYLQYVIFIFSSSYIRCNETSSRDHVVNSRFPKVFILNNKYCNSIHLFLNLLNLRPTFIHLTKKMDNILNIDIGNHGNEQ